MTDYEEELFDAQSQLGVAEAHICVLRQEIEQLRGLLDSVIQGIDDYQEPDPNAVGREWCDRFNVYLRGNVAVQLTLTIDEWSELNRWKVENEFRPATGGRQR